MWTTIFGFPNKQFLTLIKFLHQFKCLSFQLFSKWIHFIPNLNSHNPIPSILWMTEPFKIFKCNSLKCIVVTVKINLKFKNNSKVKTTIANTFFNNNDFWMEKVMLMISLSWDIKEYHKLEQVEFPIHLLIQKNKKYKINVNKRPELSIFERTNKTKTKCFLIITFFLSFS